MWIGAGYLLGFGMGMTLGLIGAGGSILTVPILVYFFGVKPVIATGYSLLVVGLVALSGAFRYWKRQLVDMRSAILFSCPAMLAVLFARSCVIPALPDPIFHVGSIAISKDTFIMIIFAFLMLFSAFVMFQKIEEPLSTPLKKVHLKENLKLIGSSASVGLITGSIGAGGGFLIIPTLVKLFKLPIKMAVGTSLAIIAINSLVGFNGDLIMGIPFNWLLLSSFLIVTLLGMWIGAKISEKVNSKQLSKLFAVFALVIGLAILSDQIINLL